MSYSPLATGQDEETRLYNLFIDKVKERQAIPIKEYHKLIDEIVEENPEFRCWSFTDVLLNHGWEIRIISEGDKSTFYMIKK